MTLEGFSERLRAAIKENEMYYVNVARKINKKTLASYLNGDTCPNAVNLARLCRVLNVSADYLLFGKNKEENNNGKKN